MKAVFFDAGGTLIHVDHPRIGTVIETVLGRTFSAEAWMSADYVGRAAVERFMEGADPGNDTSRWHIHFRHMLKDLGLSDDEFDRVGPEVFKSHKETHLWSRVVPGTQEALANLRRSGYFVAAISNADGTVEQLLANAGMTPHLSFVVDSGIVGIEKPDPRIFEIALDKAGLRAADSYYVGDVFAIDVVGARRAGLTPILLDPLGRYGDRGVRTAPDVPAFARELVSAREAA